MLLQPFSFWRPSAKDLGLHSRSSRGPMSRAPVPTTSGWAGNSHGVPSFGPPILNLSLTAQYRTTTKTGSANVRTRKTAPRPIQFVWRPKNSNPSKESIPSPFKGRHKRLLASPIAIEHLRLDPGSVMDKRVHLLNSMRNKATPSTVLHRLSRCCFGRGNYMLTTYESAATAPLQAESGGQL